MTAAAEKRVVLVKPGDVLLIGNLGLVTDPEQVGPVVRWLREEAGVSAILFAGDIQIDSAHRSPDCSSCNGEVAP